MKRVLHTTKRTVDVVLEVTLADKTGRVVETVTTTRNHPFYVSGKGFVPAGGLAIGNAIVTRAGPDAVVAQVEWKRRAEGFVVYNFEVEDDHTYFVGNSGVWVHNPVTCPVGAFEVGTFDDLTARSVPHDGLEIHHVPQGTPATQAVPGYVYQKGTAVALPRAMHRGLPGTSRLRGTYDGTAKELIETGLRDLRGAGVADDVLLKLEEAIKQAYLGIL